MDPQPVLEHLWSAIQAADKPWPKRREDKADIALEGARVFAQAVPSEFFAAYLDVRPTTVQHFLRTNGLVVPRVLAARAAFGDTGNKLSREAIVAEVGQNQGETPNVIAACIDRCKADFAGCMLTQQDALASAMARVDSLRRDAPDVAWSRTMQVLASKPYTKALLHIGGKPRKQFFDDARLRAVWLSVPANGLLLGARLAAKALQSATFEQVGRAERFATYSAAVGLCTTLLGLLQDSHDTKRLHLDAGMLKTLAHASEVWRALHQRQQDLAACLRACGPNDDGPSALVVCNALHSAYEALEQCSQRVSPIGAHAAIPKLSAIPRLSGSTESSGACLPFCGVLQDYRPWPAVACRAFFDLRRAAHGEAVLCRSYLLSGPPGTGKSTFWQAFLTDIEAQRNYDPSPWPLTVRGFILEDSAALASTFDESRRKIDSFLNGLVTRGQRDGFVPVVVVDEVDKYLKAGSGLEGAGEQENRRIGAAFTQWMDNTKQHLGNNLFFACTTNDAGLLTKPALSRFAGHMAGYDTPAAIKRRLLATAGFCWPVRAQGGPDAESRFAYRANLSTLAQANAAGLEGPSDAIDWRFGELCLAAAMAISLRKMEALVGELAAHPCASHWPHNARGKQLFNELLANIPNSDEKEEEADHTPLWADFCRRLQHDAIEPPSTSSKWGHEVGSVRYIANEEFKLLRSTDCWVTSDQPLLQLMHATRIDNDWAVLFCDAEHVYVGGLLQPGTHKDVERRLLVGIDLGRSGVSFVAPASLRLLPRRPRHQMGGLQFFAYPLIDSQTSPGNPDEPVLASVERLAAERSGATVYLGFADARTSTPVERTALGVAGPPAAHQLFAHTSGASLALRRDVQPDRSVIHWFKHYVQAFLETRF